MIEVVWPRPSMVPTVMPIIEQALKNHGLLTDKILALTGPPAEPCALFSLNAQVLERMRDVKTIVTRLLENRKLLTELALREEALRPKKRIRYGKPPSKRLGSIQLKEYEATQQMKLDMESLFIFGNLLLEQWTYVILHLVGQIDLKMQDFSKLVTTLQSKENNGLLQPLWENHLHDMIWLYYQLRSFRNMFIEHVKAPWQRGTSRESFGDNFRLATPSPVNWIDEYEIERLIRKVAYLAPSWGRVLKTTWNKNNIRQLLEIIFYHIDSIKEHAQREKVWEVWKKVGGWTPSYDMIAFRLMRFIAASQLTMLDVITKHPGNINVGVAKTGQS